MPTHYEFRFENTSFIATAHRALWWPSEGIVLIADLHAGKAEHFRRAGIAIPRGNLEADLQRLSDIVAETNPKRLIILGDIFHSQINSEMDVLAAWVRAQNCTVELVRGNHDRYISDEQFSQSNILVHIEPYAVGGFMLSHHPKAAGIQDETAWISGHIHPVYRLYGPGRDVLRLACFWQYDKQLILPSFGSFTGGEEIKRQQSLKIICCTPGYETIFRAY